MCLCSGGAGRSLGADAHDAACNGAGASTVFHLYTERICSHSDHEATMSQICARLHVDCEDVMS